LYQFYRRINELEDDGTGQKDLEVKDIELKDSIKPLN
jgi:hypothetical protein